jgi:hypothetical protein
MRTAMAAETADSNTIVAGWLQACLSDSYACITVFGLLPMFGSCGGVEGMVRIFH